MAWSRCLAYTLRMKLRDIRPRRAIAGAAAVCGLMAALPAAATIVVPLTIEEMAVRARAVVCGRVVKRSSAWDEAHKRIYTDTEIEVLDRIHDEAKVPAKIVLRALGGEVGDIGMSVSGTARFQVGEEVLVFVRSDPVQADKFQVIGMSQGKYRIERPGGQDPVAVPGLAGLSFARPNAETGAMVIQRTAHAPGQIALSVLRKRVQEAVRKHKSVVPSSPKGQNTGVSQ